MVERKIDWLAPVPPLGPGFGGSGHQAAAVIAPGDFERTNPFFLMMDDRIDATGPFGEAHPHAGLETVSFVLEGRMRDLGGDLGAGDVEWMTSGRGIVHSEESQVDGPMRLLQLWLVLPESDRSMEPRVQILSKPSMPVFDAPGVEARIYSGTLKNLTAPTRNAVPVILLDIALAADTELQLPLPPSYNGFVVVLDGAVHAGSTGVGLTTENVGWTAPVAAGEPSSLKLATGHTPARLLLYAGEPQKLSIAARGPFISGSEAELKNLFAAYRAGRFQRASSLRTSRPA
jgi:redox-sensitive bicupin YhaK (pirin superfamily)